MATGTGYIRYESPEQYGDHQTLLKILGTKATVDQARNVLDTVNQNYVGKSWDEQKKALVGMFPRFQMVFDTFDRENRPLQSIESLSEIFPAGFFATKKRPQLPAERQMQRNGGTINYFKFFK